MAALLLGLGLVTSLTSPAGAVGGSATDWMSQGKFGVMTHYLAEGAPPGDPGSVYTDDWSTMPSPDVWNTRVNNYDVQGVVQQLKSVHAGWLQIPVGQNTGYYDSPNATFDALVPPSSNPSDHYPASLLSHRDLIKDLGTALHAAGLKFMVYITADEIHHNNYVMTKLGGTAADNFTPNPTYQQNWLNIIRTWSQQWGTAVDGYWVDGAYFSNLQPYYDNMAAALRTGNPNAVMTFAPPPGGALNATYSTQSDYTSGETYSWPQMPSSRFVTNGGVQMQVNYLARSQQDWGAPVNAPTLYSAQQLGDYTQDVTAVGGDVTWDVGYDRTNGHISDAAMAQMAVVAQTVGLAPGGPTYIDDSDPAVAYTGPWNTSNPGGCYKGTCHNSQTAGNTATVTFTGTGITWYGITGTDQGTATVSVDNGPPTTVNLYASSRSTNTPVYTSKGLSNATHTLKVTATSTNWVTFDSFVARQGVVDDSNPAIAYTGSFSSSNPGGCYSGSCHNANATGSTATYTFTGTGITWYGITGSDQGTANVSIDNGPPISVNLYASSRSVNVPVYTSPELSSGTHTLTITTTNSGWVTLDALAVAQNTVDDPDPAIAYTGSFSSYNPGGCYSGSCHNANATGSTATYTFTGTGITWYGITGSDQGAANVSIDNGPPISVNLYASSRSVNVPVYTSPELSPGTHTLTITTTSNGWVTLDALAKG
ncbi:alpha-L-fucosidase [Streptomyces sp. NPDC051976]|uniref:alpha-L-fucosidase n=1 Tax=Streptomyces sp. NPDC051976 TaxID=3154947 RepID=UPI003435638B